MPLELVNNFAGNEFVGIEFPGETYFHGNLQPCHLLPHFAADEHQNL